MEKLLVGIHGGMAILSGRLEWSLDTEARVFDGMTEAEFLAKSIKDVADHYGGGMFDQKTLDWMNLTQCLLIVYGGRIFAIRSTPKPKPQRNPTVQETARDHRAAPSPMFHRTPEPVNEFVSPMKEDFFSPMNGATHEETPPTSGHVAGIGDIEFPDDNPLSPNYKPRWN